MSFAVVLIPFYLISAVSVAQYLELLLGLVVLGLLTLEGWVIFEMLRQQGRLLLRIEATESQLAVQGIAMVPDSSVPPALLPVAISGESNFPFDDDSLSRAMELHETTLTQENIELTIGMATYNDFDGVYFTLQALRLYQDLENTELLVIDNYGCEDTKRLVEGWLNARYILAKNITGTAAPRNLVFRAARGKAVLCCDCHVLFAPGAIAQLKQYYREHPDCLDLLQGPLLYDDGELVGTHFDPVWREQMWGTWGCDPRGEDPMGEAFDIPMQGLGVFSCMKRAWLGFNPKFRGFGGEEGYIHEKFRQAGMRCLCLPWLRWMHRFSRPSRLMYRVTIEEKLRNYIIGHTELGLDILPALRHFSEYLPPDQVLAVAEQALGKPLTGSSLIFREDALTHELVTVSRK
jgi:hypothetical protein